jgi:hypothetical protein
MGLQNMSNNVDKRSAVIKIQDGDFALMRIGFILAVFALALQGVAQQKGGTPTQNKKYVYQDGSPACGHLYKNGLLWKVISDSSVVMVAQSDDGKRFGVFIAVQNRSDRPVDLVPERVAVTMTAPKKRELKYEDPVRLTKKIRGRAEYWSRVDESFASNSTQQVTSQANTSGQVRANTDYYGTAGNQVGSSTSTGRYGGQTTTTTTMPNSEAMRQARERTVQRLGNAYGAAQDIETSALTARTIGPEEIAIGVVFFERDRALGKKSAIVIRVPLGDTVYEFPFSRD